MTVLEVVTFPPAEAYQTDPLSALKPFAAVLAKAGDIDSSSGASFYHGLREQDKNIAQLTIPWTSAQAFQSFVAGPSGEEVKTTFSQAVDPEKASTVSVKLFDFPEPLSEITPILAAPITEYLTYAANSPEVAEEAEKRLAKVVKVVEAIPGVSGAAIGKHVGEVVTLLAIVSWDGMQAYKDAKLTEDFDQAKNQLLEKVQFLGLYHVPQVAV